MADSNANSNDDASSQGEPPRPERPQPRPMPWRTPPSPGAYDAPRTEPTPPPPASVVDVDQAPMPWQTPPGAPPPEGDQPWQGQHPPTPGRREFGPRMVWIGIGLAIAGLLVIQGVAFIIIGDDAGDRTEITTALIATFIADIVTLVGVPFFLLGGKRPIRRSQVWAVLGLRRPTWSTLGWALAAVGLAYLGLGIYLGLVDLINVDDLQPVSTIDDDVIYDHVELVVLVTILAVLIAPITEEIFYRGFMFGGFSRRWGVVVAGVLSGGLFALAHLDVGSIIPFTIIGLVFAFVYFRSRNLLSAWGAHVLFNAIAVAGTLADRGVG